VSEQSIAPGHEWKDAEKVAVYVQNQAEPDRNAIHASAFEHLLGMLPYPGDAELRFLDLGAGAGAFSAALLERYPNAQGLLADFSAAMMDQGNEKLEPFRGRYRYVEVDLTSVVWPSDMDGPFHVAVSSRAIHHLFDDQKAALFKNVFRVLALGGVVANWDHIRRPDNEYKPGSSHGLTESSEETQLDILRAAGFGHVDCAFRGDAYRALFVGVKPA
jgi:SAM-dependent methyltransferase